jgi:hypothetical protein
MLLVIALLLSCSSGWCQSDATHSLRGDTTKVIVSIDLIRKANIKLIEHRHCPDIINAKDTIIRLERLKYHTLDSIYNAELAKCYNNVQVLQKQVNSTKRRNKILGGATIGSVAIVVLTLLLK